MHVRARTHTHTQKCNTCINILNATITICGENCELSWVQVSL